MSDNRYSSFSSVDDRFGFSKKGVFRCRIASELPIIIITVAVGCFLESLMLKTFFGTNISMNNALSATVFGLVLLAASFVFPFFLIGTIRMIMSGEEYSFIADERKMLITCPKRDIRADIIYETVQSVTYGNLTFFRKLRGYRVKVVCSTGEYIFDFLFSYRSHERSKDITPFRIIEERCGLLEKPEFFAGQRIDDDYFR